MVSYATPPSCLSHLAVVLVAWLSSSLSIYLKRRNAFRLYLAPRQCTPMCHSDDASVDLYVHCTVLRTNSKWLVCYATHSCMWLVGWLVGWLIVCLFAFLRILFRVVTVNNVDVTKYLCSSM